MKCGKMLLCLVIMLSTLLFAGCIATKTANVMPQGVTSTGSFKKTVKMTNAYPDTYIEQVKERKAVMVRLRNQDGSFPNEKCYNLKKGQAFEKFFTLNNLNNDAPETFILLYFCDMQQKDFYVDGKKVRNYSFNVQPNGEIDIPFKVDPEDEGMHEAFFVIVRQSDKKSLEDKFRLATKSFNIMYIRFNLKVGNNSSFKSFDTVTLQENNVEKPLNGISINKENNPALVWIKETVVPGAKIPYFIHIGTKNAKDKEKFALLALCNWEQVPVDNDGNKFLCVEQDMNKEAILASTLQIPQNEGIYDFTVLLVHNPFDLENYPDATIDSSIRVGLDVKAAN